jgi:hypothetical protein
MPRFFASYHLHQIRAGRPRNPEERKSVERQKKQEAENLARTVRNSPTRKRDPQEEDQTASNGSKTNPSGEEPKASEAAHPRLSNIET